MGKQNLVCKLYTALLLTRGTPAAALAGASRRRWNTRGAWSLNAQIGTNLTKVAVTSAATKLATAMSARGKSCAGKASKIGAKRPVFASWVMLESVLR